MPRPPDTGRDIIDDIITDLNALRRLPPRERIQAILPLLDRTSNNCVESRLATVRSYAAQFAVAALGGSQTDLARELGLTPQRISTIISGVSSRKAAARRRAVGNGAVGE